jgi:hypothetical protein
MTKIQDTEREAVNRSAREREMRETIALKQMRDALVARVEVPESASISSAPKIVVPLKTRYQVG